MDYRQGGDAMTSRLWRHWTPAEDAALLDTTRTIPEVAAAIGRAVPAAYKRCHQLSIHRNHAWTAGEDLRLRMAWGASLATLAKEFGRTPGALYRRAFRIGILRDTRGEEAFYAACKRVGYSAGALRLILRWAGVTVHRHRPIRGMSRQRFWVDSALVTDAVTRWMNRRNAA
jgi:hypothetical protein